jgi:hypothetical protein
MQSILIALALLLLPGAAFAQTPNHRLTPGVTRGLTQAQICNTKWGLDD